MLEDRDVTFNESEGERCGDFFSSSDSSSLLRDLSFLISLQGLLSVFCRHDHDHDQADDTHAFASGSVLTESLNRLLLHGLPLFWQFPQG